jgi:hypothetical protein
MYSINIRCLDDLHLEKANLEIKQFDGRNWEEAIGKKVTVYFLVLPITNNVRNYSDLVYWKPLFLTYRIVEAWPQTNTLAAPN